MNTIVLVAGGPQAGPSSGGLVVERLLGENSALTERVASLSQERASLRHALAALERRLRRAESDLAQVTAAETENRPVGTIGTISDAASHGKVRPETLSQKRQPKFPLIIYYMIIYYFDFGCAGYQPSEQFNSPSEQ